MTPCTLLTEPMLRECGESFEVALKNASKGSEELGSNTNHRPLTCLVLNRNVYPSNKECSPWKIQTSSLEPIQNPLGLRPSGFGIGSWDDGLDFPSTAR